MKCQTTDTRNTNGVKSLEICQKTGSASSVRSRGLRAYYNWVAFASQGVAARVQRWPCYPCALFILAVVLLAGCQYENQSYRLWLGLSVQFFFFHRANEFAGVWAVASVALRGPAIYQNEGVSTGSPKGKKHGLLYRLAPLLFFFSLSLCFHTLKLKTLLSAVFVQRE